MSDMNDVELRTKSNRRRSYNATRSGARNEAGTGDWQTSRAVLGSSRGVGDGDVPPAFSLL